MGLKIKGKTPVATNPAVTKAFSSRKPEVITVKVEPLVIATLVKHPIWFRIWAMLGTCIQTDRDHTKMVNYLNGSAKVKTDDDLAADYATLIKAYNAAISSEDFSVISATLTANHPIKK